MLMEHVAYQAEMLIDVASMLAITGPDPTNRRGGEAKLPR
jgi:hypothetical protein